MEKKLTSEGDVKQSSSQRYCAKFEKLPFPMSAFNPPQKDEYEKRICCKKCRECPFFCWPMPGTPGRDGKDGEDGRDGVDGQDGADGQHGITPHIGDNDNWWIDDVDTGIPARGVNGQDGRDGVDGQHGRDGTDGADGQPGRDGADGRDGIDGQKGEKGDPGTFNSSSIFIWKTSQQTLAPAPLAGAQGDAVEFTDFDNYGTALSFTNSTNINILEAGRYSIRWEVYKTGYDSAFSLYFDADGTGAVMLSGGNYGALSHDEKYSGQTIANLAEGGVLTLNRIDTLYPLKILNQISDEIPAIGASITVIKIA